MSTVQTISRGGDVRIVYLDNDVQIKDKTVRDAERYLESLYKEKKVLKNPVVNLTITSYSPREVAVMGEVRSPGTIAFSRDLTSMDVVDVISKAGGFTNMAKKDAVVVTHRGADGKETSQTLDLDKVISGRRTQGPDRADVLIYPGDRIFVPIRYF
jgi:polysaccharide export outer membrane protein